MSDYNLTERLAYIGLDAKAVNALRASQPVIDKEISGVLDEVYTQIRSNSKTKSLFSDSSRMDWAKTKQVEHWNRIAQGDFGEHYASAVTTVGKVHARVGLEPRYYIGSYALIVERLIGKIVEKSWPKTFMGKPAQGLESLKGQIAGVVKAALLDMDLAISVYIDSSEEMRKAAEAKALEAERRAADIRESALQQIGDALSGLAEGDLTRRLTGELPDELGKLGSDFDVAAEHLSDFALQIKAISAETSNSAREIMAGSQDLSNRTEQQASALEETAATTEELAASVKSSAQASRQAVSYADEARAVAEEGGKIVGQAVDAMARIEQASAKITEITSVIDEIAFQTNLLALNAAVEAARAGDAGKGFAVVAAEVRTLAQRSSEAAKDIGGLISTSTVEIGQGVKLVREAGSTLVRIVDASTKVLGTVSEISTATAEQANGIDEMAQAVAHMDEMTQQNAAMAEESAAASSQLSQQVQRLHQQVERFRTHEGHVVSHADDHAATGAGNEPARLRKLAAAAFTPAKSGAKQPLAKKPAPAPARAAAPAAAPRKAVGSDWSEF